MNHSSTKFPASCRNSVVDKRKRYLLFVFRVQHRFHLENETGIVFVETRHFGEINAICDEP